MSPRKKSKSTNPNLANLIRLLKKKSRENEAAIWRDAAKRLSKPRRIRVSVNVSRINRYTKEGEQVLIPGKVLGSGLINHPAKVAALDFSDQARFKILRAKGKCLSIPELIELNPKGANVKIIG
jgi:large subunit ribosomal protein L18e